MSRIVGAPRDADSLQTLVEFDLGFVHSSALRRSGDAAQATEVTRAVFLVLARRARSLPAAIHSG